MLYHTTSATIASPYFLDDNKMLLLFPNDVIECIEHCLEDIRAWRVVMKLPWTETRLKRQAKNMLLHVVPRERRQLCVHCTHQTLTELIWPNQRIEWVPYCTMHCHASFLDDVHVYCVGGLDVNGTALLL